MATKKCFSCHAPSVKRGCGDGLLQQNHEIDYKNCNTKCNFFYQRVDWYVILDIMACAWIIILWLQT